jgi:glycosyltransferase involved in cell wall biosynthesis
MIKVTHIIGGLDTGGAEMMLYKLLSITDRASFKSEVISLTTVGPVGKRIREVRVPIHALGLQRGVPDPWFIFSLARYLRQQPPDVVQTWMYHSDLIGGVAARLSGSCPVIWGIRSGTLDFQKSSKMTIWVARICAVLSRFLPERVVSCSEASRSIHVSLGYTAKNMIVIPNGVDMEKFWPDPSAKMRVRQELRVPSEALLIGLVARFDPQKDHANFIRAAGFLYTLYPDIHFLLCGDEITWDNQILAHWIDTAGIRAQCHLLGRRDDIPRLTAAMDIASLSSYGEGFPNVIIEAMACGVPCAVTDVGDAALIVGDTGRVVPPRDPQALAAAWQELIEMGAEKRAELGTRARQRVEERFSITAAAAQYEALYRELAHARSNHHS